MRRVLRGCRESFLEAPINVCFLGMLLIPQYACLLGVLRSISLTQLHLYRLFSSYKVIIVIIVIIIVTIVILVITVIMDSCEPPSGQAATGSSTAARNCRRFGAWQTLFLLSRGGIQCDFCVQGLGCRDGDGSR